MHPHQLLAKADSARFAEKFAGRGASDESNNRLLLEKLSGLPESERTARFVCCMVYKDGDVEKVFEGDIRGKVGQEPAGESGFGYDPGHSIVKARQAGLRAGAVLYKPFRLDQLLETV